MGIPVDGESTGEVPPMIVVGAGAAGLQTAIFAGREGVPVLVLESQPKPGAKIRISGGGRCNVLPSRFDRTDFHGSGDGPRLRKALHAWSLKQVRAFFEEDLGIPLYAEPNGKLFPRSDRAQDVIDGLLAEANRVGVEIRCGVRMERIEAVEGPEGAPRFRVTTAEHGTLETTVLVVATGGKSIPKTGSDGLGLELLRGMGHGCAPLHPALVPLRLPEHPWHGLAGISLPTELSVFDGQARVEQRSGDLLFTHRGISGPVALDVSRYMTGPGAERHSIRARWGGHGIASWDEELMAGGAQRVGPLVREHLPKRLADALLGLAGVNPELRRSELKKEQRRGLVEVLEACPLSVQGSEGYKKAEVTAGGVPLDELDPKTLESRLVPGLFLAGEVVDVTGRIGGFNFHWAWVSGYTAGRGAARAWRKGCPGLDSPGAGSA